MKKLLTITISLLIPVLLSAQPISQLPATTTASTGNLFVIVQNGVTKKITYDNLIVSLGNDPNFITLIGYSNGDTIFMAGDTIVVSGTNNWSLTGDDIENNNSGKVILPKDSTYFSGIPDEAWKVGRMLHVNQYGKIEWASIIRIYNDTQDSLAKMSTPSPYGTWIRDTTKAAIYQVTLTDKIGIGTNSPAKALHVAGSTRFDSELFLPGIDSASTNFWTYYNKETGSLSYAGDKTIGSTLDLNGNGLIDVIDILNYRPLGLWRYTIPYDSISYYDFDGNNKVTLEDYWALLAVLNDNANSEKEHKLRKYIKTSAFNYGSIGDSAFTVNQKLIIGGAGTKPSDFIQTPTGYVGVFVPIVTNDVKTTWGSEFATPISVPLYGENSVILKFLPIDLLGGTATGTVTSIQTTNPVVGGEITTTGTIAIDPDTLAAWRTADTKANKALQWSDTNEVAGMGIATKYDLLGAADNLGNHTMIQNLHTQGNFIKYGNTESASGMILTAFADGAEHEKSGNIYFLSNILLGDLYTGAGSKNRIWIQSANDDDYSMMGYSRKGFSLTYDQYPKFSDLRNYDTDEYVMTWDETDSVAGKRRMSEIIGGTGTITSIATTTPLTGGTITTSGTIAISPDTLTAWRSADTKANQAHGWGNHAGAGYLTAEADGSTTNEGVLSVGAGGANTSTILSNSGGTPVTISGGTYTTVTESGSTITIEGRKSGYIIPIFVGNTSSMVDETTYYFGGIAATAATTTAGEKGTIVPASGTIKAITLNTFASGTAGSDEAWTMKVKVAGSIEATIATVSSAGPLRVWTNTSMNTAVTAGDYIEIKFTTPAWATNPTTLLMGGYIYIEY